MAGSGCRIASGTSRLNLTTNHPTTSARPSRPRSRSCEPRRRRVTVGSADGFFGAGAHYPDPAVTVRPIRAFGDPILRTSCREVRTFDEHLGALVEDLLDTVRLPGRAGLAAPQIGVGLRVFSYNVKGDAGYVVNPTLVLTEGQQEGEEGCLSIPGVWSECTRPMRAVVAGFDVDGNPIEVDGTGQLGRCLQHETDHLAGRLFIDRLDPRRRKEAMRAMRDRSLFESVQVGNDDEGKPATSWLSHY